MNDFSPNISIASLSSGRAEMLAKKAEGTKNEKLTPEQRNQYAQAARGFEAMFVEMMRKQMKDAMLGDDDDTDKDGMTSFGADTLEGYADMQFSDYVSKSGKGIGIAQALYKTLTGGEELASISQVAVVGKQLKDFQVKAIEIPNVQPSVQPNVQPNISPNAQTHGVPDRIDERLRRLEPIITAAAKRNGISPALIRAVTRAESAGRHDAVSPAGAKGLMQLMDGTAADLGVRNPFDPEQNIEGGAKYLRKMMDMFGGDVELALAAYNAGPGNVRKHGGIPPFSETKQYVNRVIKYMKNDDLL